MKRVVITGIGAVCPLGNTFREAWEALVRGDSGIGPYAGFSTLKWPSAGALRGFAPGRWVSAKDTRRLDAFVVYAQASAAMAAEDAGLGIGELRDAGIIMGSSRGGIGMLEGAVRSRPTAYLMAGSTVSMAASFPAIRLGIGGHASGVSNACASGATAIGEAMGMIRLGRADIVLAGGAEAPLTRLCAEGYGRAGALSRHGLSRPFDRGRDGFVLAEGAAVLVLEEAGHAVRRGARIYAEVIGYGSSCDASHPTEPSSAGQVRAIRQAIDDAGIHPGEVGLVCAHATATPTGDEAEARSITEVFGPHEVRVTAPKSMTGHMLGASGAFEATVSVMTVHKGIVPPTINLADLEFPLDCPTTASMFDRGVVVSNSFGFGGVNAVLVFGSHKA